ncbi:unnamed protein product [Phytophthora fragariaefolia]|uniref:Unnamed protein product n=1 Tax=Phytophthora fragariaefolia TaxID=1490495 RepID=A0A9W6YQS1_9STRA|nr:unnamed protein product [Phytophthora fragariaefolia]
MNPELLYASVPMSNEGHVLSFDGSAKTEKNGGYGSCSWILWKLPAWDIEIAASAHLPSTTVNIAEYTGMNNGVIAALQRGVSDLIIVGDSRLAIQQSMGVIACRKDALQVELARHKELTKKLNSVRYLHVVRHYNSASDSMATEALEAKAGRNSTDTRENSAVGDRNSAYDGRNPAGTSENSVKAAEEPSVTATTRSRARQVRFEDEREENGDTTERSEEVFENRSRPPTRQRTTRHETEFGRNQDIAEQPVELGEVRTPDANDPDPLVIQAERRQRISKAQDEELRWADLKAYLKGEFTQLSHRRAHNAGKVADEFVLSEDGLLYRVNKAKRPEELGERGLTLRLVVPTTMIDEVLQNCHNSIEGGHHGIVRTYHRVKTDYYWIGLYADVVKHVQSCEDCSTKMMQSRSRATLSYRPQANGQQERSVKTMIQTVRTYVEDQLQADWDGIAEKLVHAINNSRDSTRRETPFYLVHGWDARSTLKAMTESIRQRQANSAEITDAAEWRREANRQREVALYLAAEFQRKEKARRAKEHNDALSRVEKRSIPVDTESPAEPTTTEMSPAELPTEPTTTERSPAESPVESEFTEEAPAEFPAESVRSLIKEGDQVWVFMERVKPGLTKKLAHRWHGPFRVKRKVEEFAYELELPDKSGYRFYPVVHVSRLKAVKELGGRPTTRLRPELNETERFAFDEELLPEDSREPDENENRFEVEAILDNELLLSTSTSRAQRRFKVQWVGYDEPSWEPLSNLSCGGLLFDYLRTKKRENRLQMVHVADYN